MSKVARISISLEESLLEKFENYVSDNGYPTRSEAIKGLMRQTLVEQEWHKGIDVAGTISIVYDHHKRGTMEGVMEVQHDFGGLILCTQHIHLEHHQCMEVVVVRGRASELRRLLAGLRSIKGIKHSSLMMTTTGGGVG